MPRVPLSKRFPILKPMIEELKILERNWQTRQAAYQLQKTAASLAKTTVFSKHQSLLQRRLGTSDIAMQDGKIHNLKIAAPKFSQVQLESGQILSFWKILGRASSQNGFINGMLIADGHAIQGVGGGLCQLANLLYWMALHSPLEVLEHHHHSLDIFPDSGRVLPFGSGASVYYNYFDLQFKNTTPYSIGLDVWLSKTHLHGMLWTDVVYPETFKIREEDHCFYRHENGSIYRRNSLFQHRFERATGRLLEKRLITANDSRVLYIPSPDVPILEL